MTDGRMGGHSQRNIFVVCDLTVQRPTFDNDKVQRWNDDMKYLKRIPVKRPLDHRLTELGDIRKRPFDKIGGYSSLGGLHKRVFDRIGGASSLGGLSKKSVNERLMSSGRFEPRAHRAFDRIGAMSSFGGLNKKTAGSKYQTQ